MDKGRKSPVAYRGRAGFLSGLQVQDFALFGAERRGPPVASFTRLDNEPIDQRDYIDEPNLVVVIDDSLLKEATYIPRHFQPVQEYLKRQGRFRHLFEPERDDETIAHIQATGG